MLTRCIDAIEAKTELQCTKSLSFVIVLMISTFRFHCHQCKKKNGKNATPLAANELFSNEEFSNGEIMPTFAKSYQDFYIFPSKNGFYAFINAMILILCEIRLFQFLSGFVRFAPRKKFYLNLRNRFFNLMSSIRSENTLERI